MTRTTLVSIGLPVTLLAGMGLFVLSGCVEGGSGAKSEVSVAMKGADSPGPGTDGPVDPVKDTFSGDPGSLSGRISISGTFTTLPPLLAKGTSEKDPEFCAAQMDIPDQKIVSKDGGVGNVVIYMDKVPKPLTRLPAPEEPVVFDQKNCTFKPRVLLCRTGQQIRIWNSDGAAHNTHTYPKKNTGFNSSVNPMDTTGDNAQIVYKKSEAQPLPVGCDFHAWMKAYHLPLDHPFAAVTAEDGSFEIKDIPPGKYRFKVWHEGKFLARRVDIEIKSGSATTLDRSFTKDELLK
ncbi:MAG: carboxypeptidase regulatory-like domain-containing protein [Planctomycetaceae bacterium]